MRISLDFPEQDFSNLTKDTIIYYARGVFEDGMELDADWCATTKSEATKHFWLKDKNIEAKVLKCKLGEWIKLLMKQSPMNPFVAINRAQCLAGNKHLHLNYQNI